jgi:hypothetical protein
VDRSDVGREERFPLIADILRGSDYALAIFPHNYVDDLKLFFRGDKPYLTCLVTGKPRPAKPEEVVRQLYLRLLVERYGYACPKVMFYESATSSDCLAFERCKQSEACCV